MRQAGGREFGLARNSSVREDILAGMADFALWGSDQYIELGAEEKNLFVFDPVCKLPLRYALLMQGAADDLPKRPVVATSYPTAARAFLSSKLNRPATEFDFLIREGRVEYYPQTEFADAAVDLVDSGDTARANGLNIMELDGRVCLGGLWLRCEGMTISRSEVKQLMLSVNMLPLPSL